MLRGLCRDLDLDVVDPAESLRSWYGARPTDDFVRDAWPAMLEGWLAKDRLSRRAVVDALWALGLREGEPPANAAEEMSFLSRRNNAKTLRHRVGRFRCDRRNDGGGASQLCTLGIGRSRCPRPTTRSSKGISSQSEAARQQRIFGCGAGQGRTFRSRTTAVGLRQRSPRPGRSSRLQELRVPDAVLEVGQRQLGVGALKGHR